MKPLKAAVCALISIALMFTTIPMAWSAPMPEQSLGEQPFVQEEIIVTFNDWVSTQDIELLEMSYGIETAQRISTTGAVVVKTPRGVDARRFVQRLSADMRVDDVQLNAKYQIEATPNDPRFKEQWGLTRIQAVDGWNIEQGQDQIIVAVIDTGVSPAHPDLAGRLVPGYNFINNSVDTRDDNGHGTHVAGIIGAQGNNSQGISGVAWQTRIMPVKALDGLGIGTDVTMASAIVWAVDHGARIVNLSVGGTVFSALMQNAINQAAAKGALVVSAAGNEAQRGNPRMYPASYDNVIAVGATDAGDQKAAFSSFGEFIDLSAPGVGILSTANNNDYEFRSGTSMAAPHVSGLAALVWGHNPQSNKDQVIDALTRNADDLGSPGKDEAFGYGRINAARTLGYVGAAGAPGEIVGLAVNRQGQAIPGTAVRINSVVLPTNAAGEFRFTGIQPGNYTIRYDAPGYVGRNQDNIIFNGGTVRTPAIVLDTINEANQGEIVGNLIDENGQPVVGAQVKINSSVANTDVNGAYSFTCVAAGVYSVSYSAAGFKNEGLSNIKVDKGRVKVVAKTLQRL